MLNGFLAQNFDELVSRTRERVGAAIAPTSTPGLESGNRVASRRSSGRRCERRRARCPSPTVGSSPPRPGTCAARWRRMVPSQVVHDYGAMRQAITELAAARGATIGLEELCAPGPLPRYRGRRVTVVEYARSPRRGRGDLPSRGRTARAGGS